jgi:hypothetical protein
MNLSSRIMDFANAQIQNIRIYTYDVSSLKI